MFYEEFDYDALSSSFILTPNSFKDFFDVHAGIEDGVTCELLAEDCSGALLGTQADYLTSLSGTHVIMSGSDGSVDSSFTGSLTGLAIDPFTILVEKNVATGYYYKACVKCKYDSITPSSRVAYSHEVTSSLMIIQNAEGIDCDNVMTSPTNSFQTTLPYVIGGAN